MLTQEHVNPQADRATRAPSRPGPAVSPGTPSQAPPSPAPGGERDQRPPDALGAQLARAVAARTPADVAASRSPTIGRKAGAKAGAARDRTLDERVAEGLDTRPADAVYETPVPTHVTEAMAAAIKGGLDAVKKLEILQDSRYALTDFTRFTPEHAAFWKNLPAKYQDKTLWNAAAGGSLPQGVYVVAGVLSAVDLAMRADPKDPLALLDTVNAKHDVSVRGVSHDFGVIVQALQVIHTFGGMVTYLVARARGLHAAAAEWYKLFTAAAPKLKGTLLELGKANLTPMGWYLPLRTLSFLLTGVQIVHGLAALLGGESDSERLMGGFETVLGGIGVPGIGFTAFGMEGLWGISGAGTAVVLAAGVAGYYTRKHFREVDIDNSAEHVEWIFGMLQEGSAEIVKDANALETTLRFRDEALMGSTGEAGELAAGAQRRALEQTTALRDSMVLVFLDLANPGLQVPEHIKRPFVSVKRRADRSKMLPEGMLEAAATFLAIVKDLFEHRERTIARTLRERDQETAAGLLSHPTDVVLVGLHDDVKKDAALDEKSPGPVHRPRVPAAGGWPSAPSRPRGTKAR